MKKAFTLIELLGIIIILGILTLIAIPAVNNYILKTEEAYYKNLENIFKDAVIDYISDNQSLLPDMLGNVKVVEDEEVEKLIKEKYVDELTDTKGNKCEEAKVIIIRNGTNDYEYIPCLKCGTYQSKETTKCYFNKYNN